MLTLSSFSDMSLLSSALAFEPSSFELLDAAGGRLPGRKLLLPPGAKDMVALRPEGWWRGVGRLQTSVGDIASHMWGIKALAGHLIACTPRLGTGEPFRGTCPRGCFP